MTDGAGEEKFDSFEDRPQARFSFRPPSREGCAKALSEQRHDCRSGFPSLVEQRIGHGSALGEAWMVPTTCPKPFIPCEPNRAPVSGYRARGLSCQLRETPTPARAQWDRRALRRGHNASGIPGQLLRGLFRGPRSHQGRGLIRIVETRPRIRFDCWDHSVITARADYTPAHFRRYMGDRVKWLFG